MHQECGSRTAPEYFTHPVLDSTERGEGGSTGEDVQHLRGRKALPTSRQGKLASRERGEEGSPRHPTTTPLSDINTNANAEIHPTQITGWVDQIGRSALREGGVTIILDL